MYHEQQIPRATITEARAPRACALQQEKPLQIKEDLVQSEIQQINKEKFFKKMSEENCACSGNSVGEEQWQGAQDRGTLACQWWVESSSVA